MAQEQEKLYGSRTIELHEFMRVFGTIQSAIERGISQHLLLDLIEKLKNIYKVPEDTYPTFDDRRMKIDEYAFKGEFNPTPEFAYKCLERHIECYAHQCREVLSLLELSKNYTENQIQEYRKEHPKE